jgi:predicted RNase H-like HicB family nuclease
VGNPTINVFQPTCIHTGNPRRAAQTNAMEALEGAITKEY